MPKRRGTLARAAVAPKSGQASRPAPRPPGISADGDIVAQLRSLLPSLAPAERRVGELVVGDPARVAQLTITELAAEASTSETTVIRFCRSVGVSSYPALRLLVATWGGRNEARDQPRVSPEIDPEDDLGAIVARIGQSVSDSVHETIERIDLEALEWATAAISRARRVDVYGVGASGLVAEDLQHKLHRIGLSAWVWPDPHQAITSAANLGPQDVVVAVSHSGRTTDTLDPVMEARDRGAAVIAITNFSQSPVAAAADVVLTTVSDETTLRSGAMGSRIAALVIVDCLFSGVATQHWTQTTDALVRTSQAVAARRPAPRGRR